MENLMNIEIKQIDGQFVTDSKAVAERFQKRHDHVLRDVDDLKKDLPNFGEMFFETEIHDSYGRPQRAYNMNRDGFSLLAMGFNGKNALKWKVLFIQAFNAMEEAWNSPEKVMARALDIAHNTINNLTIENTFLIESNEELQTQLDTSKDWYSIKRVAAMNGVSWKRFDWRKLKKAGEKLGFEVKKIFDANYGEVNTYHKLVWEAVYPQYEL